MLKDKKIIGGAVALGIGAFATKLLGAIYRVPLTNLIGGFGLGLYQLVFPVYSVLLDFSGAGVPSALSKIISSVNEEQRKQRATEYLKTSLKIFSLFGLICSLLMLVFSFPLARLQGNESASISYMTLAPAVILVSLISCYRGYFQGFMHMKPTAISQIIEQAVKLLFGLLFAYLLLPNVSLAVAGATFAVSVSELVALAFLMIKYKRHSGRFFPNLAVDTAKAEKRAKNILKVVFPVTLVGIMLPLSHTVDSLLVVNILGKYRDDATTLYGLLSGVVCTIIGLPVSVCYGISAVAIPAVSGAKSQAEKNKNAVKTLFFTFIVSLPCAIFCAYFAPFIIRLLFRRLSFNETVVAIRLLRISSPCVVLLSLLQTANAVLIGKGEFYKPTVSLTIGVMVKTIVNVILLKMPELNIYGGAFGLIACYFTATLVNFILMAVSRKRLEFSDRAKLVKIKAVENESKRSCRGQYQS